MLDKQILFSQLAAKLIQKADELGYGVTFGDCYRDERCKYGSRISKHRERLAIDLNLFRKDEYGVWRFLTKTEDHKELGEWWEQQHPDCRWGGHWNDGNHYEIWR